MLSQASGLQVFSSHSCACFGFPAPLVGPGLVAKRSGPPPPLLGGMVFLGRPASWHLWRVLGNDGAVGLVSYGDPFAVDFIASVFDSGAFSPDSFSLPRLAEM